MNRLRKKLKHILFTFFSLLLLLLVIQTFGYYYNDSDTKKISTIEPFLPQFTKLKNTAFDFVCVRGKSSELLTNKQKMALKKIFSKYVKTIYFNMADIPKSSQLFDLTDDGDKIFAGYKSGYIITWEEKSSIPFFFKTSYNALYYYDHAGNDYDYIASATKATYIWFYNRWLLIGKFSMWI